MYMDMDMDMYMYVRDNILSYKTTKIKRESLHCKQFHSKFAWEYFYRSFLFLLLGDVILGNFSREFIEHFEKLSVDGRQLFTRVLDQLPHRDKGTEKEREREGRGGRERARVGESVLFKWPQYVSIVILTQSGPLVQHQLLCATLRDF